MVIFEARISSLMKTKNVKENANKKTFSRTATKITLSGPNYNINSFTDEEIQAPLTENGRCRKMKMPVST